MPSAIGDTLRQIAAPRERRDALRRSAPTRDTVVELLREAREWRRRDPASATRLARSALAIARAGRAADLAAEASHVLGQAELLLGRPRHALRRQRAAADRADPGIRLSVAIETAASLALLGYESEARSALADARRLARGKHRAAVCAAVDLTEANLLVRLDRDADALALYARARRVLSRAKQASAVATVDLNRANALTNLNRLAAADRLYRRALAYHRRAGQEATARQVEYNRAYLQCQRGRYAQGIEEMLEVRQRFEQAGEERHVALCDLDLAEMHLRLNLPSAAVERARAAAASLGRLGLAHDAARARLFLATATRGLGKPAEARAELEEARAALRDVGAAAWEAVALHRLAEIDAETGFLDRARRRASEAADRLFGLGLLERAGRAEVLVARMDLALHGAEAAEKRLDALATRIRGLHAPWLSCELHREWARALDAGGKKREALRHVLEAVRLFERHRVAVPPDEHMGAYLRQRETIHEEAIGYLVRVGGSGATDGAFRIVQRAKEVALLDRLGEMKDGKGRALAAALKAQEIVSEIDALLARMPSDEPHRRAGHALRASALAAAGERRLASVLRDLSKGAHAAGLPGSASSPTSARMRSALPEDVTLVEYFLAQDEAFAFLATRGSLALERWPLSRERVRELVGHLRTEVSRPPEPAGASGSSAEPVPAGRAGESVLASLYATLVQPIAGSLSTRRLVFVPHDVLDGVPFHALGAGARPLLQDHEVVVVPTSDLYLRGLVPRAAPRGRPLVVSAAATPTAEAQEEARAAAARWPGSRLALGPTPEGSRDPLDFARQARWIHVAGDSVPSHGESQGVLDHLSRRGLTAEVVIHIPPTSFGTGGGLRGADRLEGARGLLRAGARSVVLSLWPVESGPARLFLARLEEALPRLPVARAAREACLATREGYPSLRDWAGFEVVGAGGPVEDER